MTSTSFSAITDISTDDPRLGECCQFHPDCCDPDDMDCPGCGQPATSVITFRRHHEDIPARRMALCEAHKPYAAQWITGALSQQHQEMNSGVMSLRGQALRQAVMLEHDLPPVQMFRPDSECPHGPHDHCDCPRATEAELDDFNRRSERAAVDRVIRVAEQFQNWLLAEMTPARARDMQLDADLAALTEGDDPA